MNYFLKRILSLFTGFAGKRRGKLHGNLYGKFHRGHISGERVEQRINPQKVKEILHGILTTKKEEISCDECFEELDRFVEIELQGKNPAEAMPLVQDHLDRCRDCREEYQTLLEVLRNMQASGSHSGGN